jgi:hypothetical protein
MLSHSGPLLVSRIVIACVYLRVSLFYPCYVYALLRGLCICFSKLVGAAGFEPFVLIEYLRTFAATYLVRLSSVELLVATVKTSFVNLLKAALPLSYAPIVMRLIYMILYTLSILILLILSLFALRDCSPHQAFQPCRTRSLYSRAACHTSK